MAMFGGAVADWLGFRRALLLAYLVLSISYFLLGSIASNWIAPLREVIPLFAFVALILALPAVGVALVKPCVAGTTARTSTESNRSVCFSIYYTLVNVGGAAGPLVASAVHKHLQVRNVFYVASLTVLIMFGFVIFCFREPPRTRQMPSAVTPVHPVHDFIAVLSNWRFILFLLIFSGYYIAFWQQFILLPLYVHDYINPGTDTERLLMTDSLTVITLQMVMAFMVRRMAALSAVALGTLTSGLAWLILAAHASALAAVLTIFVIALGEIIQQPRYYDYISRLAPPGQQGTYMGFAFVPIGIGSLVGGSLAGKLAHYFGEVIHCPWRIWWTFAAIGAATAVLLILYDRTVARREPGNRGDNSESRLAGVNSALRRSPQ